MRRKIKTRVITNQDLKRSFASSILAIMSSTSSFYGYQTLQDIVYSKLSTSAPMTIVIVILILISVILTILCWWVVILSLFGEEEFTWFD